MVVASLASAVIIRIYADPATAIRTPVAVSSACTTPTVPTAKFAGPAFTATLCDRTVKTATATSWALTKPQDPATTALDNVHAYRMLLDNFATLARRITGE